MSLLRPLLLDVVPSIQQTAALALGRLADHSDDLAEAVVKEDILPQLVHSLASQNVSISSFVPLDVHRLIIIAARDLELYCGVVSALERLMREREGRERDRQRLSLTGTSE